jgi:hypothetical protein
MTILNEESNYTNKKYIYSHEPINKRFPTIEFRHLLIKGKKE